MPSSYTSSARFNLQATGENNNTWGVILNQGVFQLVDDSVCGRLAFALSGAKALTVNQGATDEARMAFLDVTGGAGGTITVPSVAKGYFVHNGAAGVVNLSAGGPLLPIQPGDAGPVFGDGATLYPILVGGLTITAQFAAMKSYVDSAIAGAVVNLPAMIGHAGQLLTNDGTVASWGPRISDAYAFRNRIINGDMRIDQRHAGANFVIPAGSASGLVSVDRWRLMTPISGALNVARIAVAWQPTSYAPNALQIGVNTAQAVLTANEYGMVTQSIEGLNVGDLKWGTVQAQPVTVSFVIAATVAGDYGVSLLNVSGALCYLHKITLVSGATTKVSFTVPGPTTGVWPTDNTSGIGLRICLGCGVNFQTPTLDVWQAANMLGPPTQVNMFASAANAIYLTDVQFEVGTVATPFERRAYAQELTLCQRYYETNFSVGTAPAENLTQDIYVGAAITTGNLYSQLISFKVPKRAVPAVTYYSSGLVVGSPAARWGYYTGTAWVTSTSATIGGMQVTTNNMDAAMSGAFVAQGSYLVSGGWTADCEL